VNIFAVERAGEKEALAKFTDLSNQKLLFHGSSIESFAALFQEGMRIDHKEKNRTGSSLG